MNGIGVNTVFLIEVRRPLEWAVFRPSFACHSAAPPPDRCSRRASRLFEGTRQSLPISSASVAALAIAIAVDARAIYLRVRSRREICDVVREGRKHLRMAQFRTRFRLKGGAWRGPLAVVWVWLAGPAHVFAQVPGPSTPAAAAPAPAAPAPAAQAAAAPPAAPAAVKLPPEQLDSLVAPIALYPDPVLAQALAASTYPLEIIQLQQWQMKNPSLKDKALADTVA